MLQLLVVTTKITTLPSKLAALGMSVRAYVSLVTALQNKNMLFCALLSEGKYS